MTQPALIVNGHELDPRGRFAASVKANPPRWSLDAAGGVASLHLYGAIGGFWGEVEAATIVPAIRDLDAATLDVYINSPGGDVFDGIAIRNAIIQSSAHVVTHVDGLAASAASFIATAGDEVVMGDNAQMMIHEAWTIVAGNADDLRAESDTLDRISANIAAMYAAKAGGDPETWRDLMRAETWYTGSEAVDAGLADRVAGAEAPADAEVAAQFDLSMFAHAGRQLAPAPLNAIPAPRKENRMTLEQLRAALAAGTITQAQFDASVAALNAMASADDGTAPAPESPAPAALAVQNGIPGVAVPAEYSAGPQGQVTPAGHTQARPATLDTLMPDLLAAARRDDLSGFIQTVNNALDPIVPANDAGEAFLRSDNLGALWQAAPEGRPVIQSLGGARPLTTAKIEGFVWTLPTPAPEPYAGNLAEIPSDTWTTAPVTVTPDRWAKGNRIDRIYVDLGSEDLIRSLFAILDANYQGVSDSSVFADLEAGATAITGGTTSLMNAITKAFLQLRRIGARPSTMWMAEDTFLEFSELTVADLPAWIANATGFVNLDGSTSLSNVFDVDVNFDLGAGEFLAYDPRAATVFEKGPIHLEALVIPNGGIDIGWFSYGGTLINDPRAIVKSTITPTP